MNNFELVVRSFSIEIRNFDFGGARTMDPRINLEYSVLLPYDDKFHSALANTRVFTYTYTYTYICVCVRVLMYYIGLIARKDIRPYREFGVRGIRREDLFIREITRMPRARIENCRL